MIVRKEKAQAQEGFEAAKSKVIGSMRAFESACGVLIKLSVDKSISFVDMRTELAKIEAQYQKLREEKADIESKFLSMGDAELATRFTQLVG